MIEQKKEFKLISKKNPKSLLPNTLTIFGVCLGLSSIKFAIDTNYAMAVIAIGFAAILDTLDGRVARLIKGTSKVGKELDSLTDVISFGVAPGFIMYFWTLNELGKFGWMFVLIYAVCCALRLARFNLTIIEDSETWKINFFEGVPSPAAAGLVLLPLIDALTTFISRLKAGKPIYKNDRRHFHFILYDSGVSKVVVILIISGMSMLATALCLYGHFSQTPDYIMFYGFLTIWFFYFLFLNERTFEN